MAVEEHVGEPHPFSKSVPDKELSSTEPKSDSCIKDNGVKDQVVNTSDIELHINDPTTNSPIKDKDQQPIKEGQQPIDDGEKIERSTVQSSIINSSDGPIDYKALQKVRKTARSEEVSSKEKDKQRNQGEITDRKNIQGNYIGVMMLMGDYWRNNVSTAETNARLILNKQCGGLKLLLMLRKVALQKPDALENCFTDHMPAKEMTIKVVHPSDPASENGIKEKRIELDGEMYLLKEPHFSARFHPKVVQLFASPTEQWLWKNNKIM